MMLPAKILSLPSTIHANLSAPERMRAAVAAMARGDAAEVQTLKETCPKKSFLITDPDYAEGMERLFSLASAVESDLQKMALDFLLASRMADAEGDDTFECAIFSAASMEIAWRQLLAGLGISAEEMTKASMPRHHAVIAILQLSEGEEDPEIVASYLEKMREYLAA